MYPSPVTFLKAPAQSDDHGQKVVVRWTSNDAFSGFLAFCSRVDVTEEATEAFYSGAFSSDIRRVRLDADARVLVDERAPEAAWYLVLGLDNDGHLHAVEFELERPAGAASDVSLAQVPPARIRVVGDSPANIYQDLPELVYRDDDVRAAGASRMLAASLTARHGADE